MQLTVQNVAELLNVSEKTVYRWINDGSLPGYRVSGQYRFYRAEVLEWATSRKIQVSPIIFVEPESPTPLPSLLEALHAGGIHYRVGGVDRDFLLKVLLAREGLTSTGIGDGLAVPHVRNPVVLHVNRPMISLCFLEKPVDFAAIDGKPVHALFTLISPTVRAHLHLLSRLAFALRDARLKEAVMRQAFHEEILAELHRLEEALPRK
jgi:PTS system nitrogen regulatory IIA component